MHEIFDHDGDEFECSYLSSGKITKGKIKIEINGLEKTAFLCQEDVKGSAPKDKLGYKYGYTFIQMYNNIQTYRSININNFRILSNIPSNQEELRNKAELLAKELLTNSTDEEIDAFINGYIMGYNNKITIK